MAFDLNIKNVGKLDDAKIRIGQFTVLAGPNNTGKSFVSKILYSIFNAMNANYAEMCTTQAAEPSWLTLSGIKPMLRDNLIHNFQVRQLSDLRGKKDTSSEVGIDGFGKLTFKNGEIEFDVDPAGLQRMQGRSNVIYLESPIYWKLKTALEDIIGSHPRQSRNGRGSLVGVPRYFHDAAKALRGGYTGDIAFPDLYKRLTGEGVIDGKITISESGDLLFQENGSGFSSPIAAMGVANLGILALLIERRVLDESSFLFMDEPEAHLHPDWQVVMAESLFELAKGGVNVVVTTYSAEILKWLEVHVKKNPDDEGLIALNKFPANGLDHDKQDFKEKMTAIKQELTKPFSDLYMEGL